MSLVDDLTSYAASVVRMGKGFVRRDDAGIAVAPARLLELYDFEACPYCRKVREVLCELDLDYLSLPTARGSVRREALRALGGKVQVPYLVDPNAHVALYESDEIIAYLNRTYGRGGNGGWWPPPVPAFVNDLDSALATVVRLGRGGACRAGAAAAAEPLVLYNMEASPYCRKVREALSELDLAFVVRNVPKGSPKRQALVERGGKMQVPYLVDPNADREMYESDDIVAYLATRYGPAAGRGAAATA
jgi:glutathione S-transferase